MALEAKGLEAKSNVHVTLYQNEKRYNEKRW